MPAIEAALSRKLKVEKLATLIWDNLCSSYLSEIRYTGALVPTNSLRHRSTRERLQWASKLSIGAGRWFTDGMIKDALAKLLVDPGFELPDTPGFSKDTWLSSTSSSLSKLLSRARRTTVSAMDCDETQPWGPFTLDPTEDRVYMLGSKRIEICSERFRILLD